MHSYIYYLLFACFITDDELIHPMDVLSTSSNTYSDFDIVEGLPP